MKKLILLLSMILSINAYSQNLNGCMGIMFGDNMTEVKAKMMEKPEFRVYNSKTNSLSYLDGRFAGHEAIGAVFQFDEDKLHTIVILLEVEQKPMVMNFYREIMSELSQKYSVVPEKTFYFRKPYYEGDGYEHNAISLGYAEISSIYTFQDGNVVSLEITKELSVKITYQNTRLAEIAVNKNKQKNSNDY